MASKDEIFAEAANAIKRRVGDVQTSYIIQSQRRLWTLPTLLTNAINFS